jgi:hypothetical protein
MDTVIERCAGLDVHKDTVMVCVCVVPAPRGDQTGRPELRDEGDGPPGAPRPARQPQRDPVGPDRAYRECVRMIETGGVRRKLRDPTPGGSQQVAPGLRALPHPAALCRGEAEKGRSFLAPERNRTLGHGRGRLRIVVHPSEMPCTFCAPFAAENGRVWPLSATGRFDAETVAAQGFPALAPRRASRCQVSSNLPPSASIPPITFATCPDDRRGRRKVPGRFPF